MSLQSEILKKMKSKNLWTSPNGYKFKQEFLPSYMKMICDGFLKSNTARRVFPVEVSVNFILSHNSISVIKTIVISCHFVLFFTRSVAEII